MTRAPFLPLVANADGLDLPPAPARLRQRMAEVYGVEPAQVLPVAGVWHGIALVLRLAKLEGATRCAAAPSAQMNRLARISGIELGKAKEPDIVVCAQADAGGLIARPPRWLMIDESFAEFASSSSLAPEAVRASNVVVLRSLNAYGLQGAPCGALLGSEDTIARLETVVEPDALSAPVIKLAEAVLTPARVAINMSRVARIKVARAQLAVKLEKLPSVAAAGEEAGPAVWIRPTEEASVRAALRALDVTGAWREDGVFVADIPDDAAANARLLSAFGGVESARGSRSGEVVRETAETRIAVRVDLDETAPVSVATGVGFYDHMLSQIALHGGFALQLACEGDLEVDAHHTVEDCALALGAALRQALGDRRGIARFGFVLPMDEAEAKVSIDLGGRPYSVFEGNFAARTLGEYPTEMTEHVFRSLAQTLGAAIHVSVIGENDHHKTEACFKALGRALRQAIRVEGDWLPSSKGVIE